MYPKLLSAAILFILSVNLHGQLLNHYWVNNFNSLSSLLGGAVVAGEGDNTAIYYNPATITQMQKGSNFSVAANLFTWNFYILDNALGHGIGLSTDNFLVQPQFISYTYTPPNKYGISLAASALTRVKEKMEKTYTKASYMDVIKRYPGLEKYNTYYSYRNNYTDAWVGLAAAQQVNDNFSYGVTMFASFSTLIYNNTWSATAYNPNDTIGFINFNLAEGAYSESIKFTDYRLIFKIGFAYQIENWKFGFNITTTSLKVFSSGKTATRMAKQSNIAYEGNLLPDYIIFDGQNKSDLKTNYKMPWSFAFGFIYDMPNEGRRIYLTAEYFTGIKQYKMVEAQIRDDITTPPIYEILELTGEADWLSFGYGARPVFNVAIGYSLTIKKDLIFLNAFRTDFSAVNKDQLLEDFTLNYITTSNFNIYHYSAGVKFSLGKNRFIAGADLGFGYKLNQEQITNFSDPVEFIPDGGFGRALQGPLENKMDSYYIGINFYIAATLNFSKNGTEVE
ncbi:MAG: hypothetical protein P8100_02215 [bacterium]